MATMADTGAGMPPRLASWAEVDPARYPFDPVEVPAVVRTMTPVPPARPSWRDGRCVGNAEAWAWVDAVGTVLSGQYGPWAYYWHWAGPGEDEQLGLIVRRIPAPGKAPAFVTESLLIWRRWLDSLAERFDRFLPLLDPVHESAPSELVAAWEAAIAHLMMAAVAPTVDPDRWQGWCHMVLRWFLTAAGVPVERTTALVNEAFGQRFDFWVPLTTADITDVAERLTRDVLSPAGTVPIVRPDDWPDTWPQGWPSWRATNTGWGTA